MCSNPLILNQGELTIYCLFIGMKYSSFNSQYISNAKRLFYETLSPKKHGQVSYKKNVIRIQQKFQLLRHHVPSPHIITLGNNYVLHHQVRGKVLPQN